MSIKEQLLELGFLTGSRAFGTSGAGSDFDIVISVTELQKVHEIIKGFTITESNYFKGFYIEDNGEKINIIPVHPDDYVPWYLTTKAMTAILSEVHLEKHKKYAVFSGIRALVSASGYEIRNKTI